MAYAIMKYVDGKSGKNSMLAWAGQPFQIFQSEKVAKVACNITNELYKEYQLPYQAFVSCGKLTDSGWEQYEKP